MTVSNEYTHQPPEAPDTNVLSLASLFSSVASVFVSTVFIVILAIIFPWKGGYASGTFAFLYYLTVAVSFYTFVCGYIEIYKRGLDGFDIFFWVLAMAVTLIVTTQIILFGSILIDAPITFPGSDTLMTSAAFFLSVVFQAFYFLIESVLIALKKSDSSSNSVGNWYSSMYLLLLSVDSAAVILGLLILEFSSVIL